MNFKSFDALIKEQIRKQAEEIFLQLIEDNKKGLLKLEKRWLSKKEVSEYMGISPRSADAYATRGVINKHYFSGSVRFDKQEIDAYMEAQKSRVA